MRKPSGRLVLLGVVAAAAPAVILWATFRPSPARPGAELNAPAGPPPEVAAPRAAAVPEGPAIPGFPLSANSEFVYVLLGDRIVRFGAEDLKSAEGARLPALPAFPARGSASPRAGAAPPRADSGERSLLPPAPPLPAAGPDLRALWSHGTAEGAGPVRLAHFPLDPEDVRTIMPMGVMDSTDVTPADQLRIIPRELQSGRQSHDVRAPADGWIVSVRRRTVPQGYHVVIEHSGTFWSHYDNLTGLHPSIRQGVGVVATGAPKYVRLRVRAGQPFGTTGGDPINFGVVNSEITLPGMLVPGRYSEEPWKIHTVDPFEYCDEPLRTRLLSLCPRKVDPRGGRIDYDVDGRLVGNWFMADAARRPRAGAPMPSSRRLTFGYHHVDPAHVVISLGDFGGAPRQFWIKENRPDPATVTETSGVVRYQLVAPRLDDVGEPRSEVDESVQGVLLAQVLPRRRIRVEAFPGKSSEEVPGFTAAARTYAR